jgi:hypothetical protein
MNRRTLCFLNMAVVVVAGACTQVDPSTTTESNVVENGPRMDVFACQTDAAFYDGTVQHLDFAVTDIDEPDRVDLVWPSGDGLPIRVVPSDSPLSALNENVSVAREDGKIVISGDSDGFFSATLALLEDGGFRKGSVDLDDSGDESGHPYIGGDQSTTVSCSVVSTNATAACRADSDCGSGRVCAIPQCEPSGPCPAATCVFAPGRCYTNGDCKSGTECALPACEPGGACPAGTCVTKS